MDRIIYQFESLIANQQQQKIMFEAPEKKVYSWNDENPEALLMKEIELEYAECGICNQFFEDRESLDYLCECEHMFCKMCLKYYVTHKLKNQFADIECPRQGCGAFINKEGNIYQSLPKQLQNRYEKIKQNLNSIKFRVQRRCPNCTNQMSMLKNQSNLFCENCLIKYCPICLNKAHPKYARCQAQVIKLLKRSYKYKQCRKCLFIVERIQGCNHMTCTCGYQFCYICGGEWKSNYHECPPIRPYRPLIIRTIKRQIPKRQTFHMASVNISLNLEIMNRQKKIVQPSNVFIPQNSKKRTKTMSTQKETLRKNTFMKNNFSFMKQEN